MINHTVTSVAKVKSAYKSGGDTFKLDGEIDTYVTLFRDDIEWELYEEPKPEIKLTPEMVGRKVRLRNGVIRILECYDPNESDGFNYETTISRYKKDGRPQSGNGNLVIVEVLPK